MRAVYKGLIRWRTGRAWGWGFAYNKVSMAVRAHDFRGSARTHDIKTAEQIWESSASVVILVGRLHST